ncbi:MAG: hypothetical protein HYR88_09445 [Verrucomicrobia bacterium]|nr:hypothetical protein [Verrucomicrobiota bacterium]MBI3870974.1 hypothetical protein [Verrucomicrobiota bacterium]
MGLPLIKLSAEEEAQLTQTIEMFEVITQGQPQDYQSLEILKEAYVKLGREEGLIGTSKRLAEAYIRNGQLSSAILEYESLLQHKPDDAEVQAALQDIEAKARGLSEPAVDEPPPESAPPGRKVARCIDDGSKGLHKAFVEGKVIGQNDFDLCWIPPDYDAPAGVISNPFIQNLADKSMLPIERSLKVLLDKSRLAYIPLGRYDADADTARKFDAEMCRRWCILPFDRMSKTILVATANPFNQQATLELEQTQAAARYQFYLAAPADIIKALKSIFR